MRRLELYESETVPIIDFYRERGRLVVVDGVGDGDEVFERSGRRRSISALEPRRP